MSRPFAEEFLLASTYSELYTRPIDSETPFTKFRKSILTGAVTQDASYDPVTDQIFWIEQLYNRSIPDQCSTTVSINRCNFDGSNGKLLVDGINIGADCVGGGKYQYA